ncbi:MAG: hypothetical protein J1F10_04490 [Muribaculaceae bacterium]|nr:hypothetical protein [Muribaculaceae bacterium]
MTVAVLTWAREPKVKTTTVENVYVCGPHETLESGRLNAIQEARLKAIAKEFNSAIFSSSQTSIRGENGIGTENFSNYTVNDVSGEWIETISEEVEPFINNSGLHGFRVKLKGKVREIITNHIDVVWEVLVNGTNPQANRIREGTLIVNDYMYLYFMSPVDGYIAVYLEDNNDAKTTQCLVPYRGMNEGAMKIEANKPYIFFSREDAEPEIKQKVSRIKVSTTRDVDYNQLHIVFSPNQFSKVTDYDSSEPNAVTYDRNGNSIALRPRQTDSKSFHTWLAKTRMKDPDMQYRHEILTIKL